ncbi:E7 [Cervus papillomavirus 2]|uniref:E7 n=1 Tax=Cervus elaphus papillomavirus 1 TaxID=1163699 RepID=A0A182BAE9_9PAPI|nr:E7 [Cervus papillomavirus 2]ALX18687.1 E7 [Cervus papillomavirus 2]
MVAGPACLTTLPKINKPDGVELILRKLPLRPPPPKPARCMLSSSSGIYGVFISCICSTTVRICVESGRKSILSFQDLLTNDLTFLCPNCARKNGF